MSFPLKRELVGMPLEDQEAQTHRLVSDLCLIRRPRLKTPGERIDLRLCLESPYFRDDHVLTDLTDKQLKSRLGRLALNAKTSMTEQGVPTLYVTFGLLKWFESPDSQVQILSPLLLFPVEMERENVESPWNMKLQEEEVAAQSLARPVDERTTSPYGYRTCPTTRTVTPRLGGCGTSPPSRTPSATRRTGKSSTSARWASSAFRRSRCGKTWARTRTRSSNMTSAGRSPVTCCPTESSRGSAESPRLGRGRPSRDDLSHPRLRQQPA